MTYTEIDLYLERKIPIQGHALSDRVHHFSLPEYNINKHPFIRMLIEALYEINRASEGFAVKMIDRISEITDAENFQSSIYKQM